MEVHVLMLLEPPVVLGLVGVEVAEGDMEIDVGGVVGHEFVHEG